MRTSLVDRIADQVLGEIRDRGTYRRMRRLEGMQGPRMRVDGREVSLFAGSNYLDLASHPKVIEAAARGARDWGAAAGGSRLISGNLAIHEALEEELAAFFGTEAALAFNTGYMANVGVIPALVGPGDVIVSDELNHASIIDGARLARSQVAVFRHGDIDSFTEVLREARSPGLPANGARATTASIHGTDSGTRTRAGASARRILVAVDGVYSMDGDVAPLAEIVKLAHEAEAMVLLDDAHGTGILGPRGRGTAEAASVLSEVDILMGTLGKSIGSFGAFIAGSQKLRDLLVNTARSFIFSCALAPAQVEASRTSLQLIDDEPWRRQRLGENCDRLRDRLAKAGISTAPSTTHILPIVLGDNERTMTACERLLERGYYAQGIRHPSVPFGTARLRVTPMASHEESEIDGLADAIIEIMSDCDGASGAAPVAAADRGR